MTALNPAAALPRWVDSAACATTAPGMFFGSSHLTVADAKHVCASCPVSGLCLEFGLAEPVGVYGGLGPKARKKLRRDLRRLEKAGRS